MKDSREAVPDAGALLRRGFALEYATLGWNVIGIVVLAIAAISARSTALAGFALDSLIETAPPPWWCVGALRHRGGPPAQGDARDRDRVHPSGAYLLIQSTWVLVAGFHAQHKPGRDRLDRATTAVVMLALADGKSRTGAALDNPILKTEGRVTLIDGLLARPSCSDSS